MRTQRDRTTAGDGQIHHHEHRLAHHVPSRRALLAQNPVVRSESQPNLCRCLRLPPSWSTCAALLVEPAEVLSTTPIRTYRAHQLEAKSLPVQGECEAIQLYLETRTLPVQCRFEACPPNELKILLS